MMDAIPKDQSSAALTWAVVIPCMALLGYVVKAMVDKLGVGQDKIASGQERIVSTLERVAAGVERLVDSHHRDRVP